MPINSSRHVEALTDQFDHLSIGVKQRVGQHVSADIGNEATLTNIMAML